MDDKKYDSRYDGETTDKILDNAKAIKVKKLTIY